MSIKCLEQPLAWSTCSVRRVPSVFTHTCFNFLIYFSLTDKLDDFTKSAEKGLLVNRADEHEHHSGIHWVWCLCKPIHFYQRLGAMDCKDTNAYGSEVGLSKWCSWQVSTCSHSDKISSGMLVSRCHHSLWILGAHSRVVFSQIW